MKLKSKLLAMALACLMIFVQLPLAVFAQNTDIRAELLSPDTLPDGRFDVQYNVKFNFDYSKFDNGYQWYSWSIISGTLPPGLELGAQHSTWQPVLTGIPTKAGTYTFTIKGGRTDYINGENVPVVAAVKTYTLKILPDYPLEFSTDYLNHGYGSSYSDSCYITYGRDAEWKLEAVEGETLPEGLSINSSTGNITWENAEVGKYNLKITATRYGNSVSKVFKLIIEPEGGCKHTKPIKTTRTAATCKKNGLADYWYCDDCERYYLNEKCTVSARENLDDCYTTAFHSDKNDDGKCDTCDKGMPIFKKVTEENEITSGGMYLVVSKIGDKYYTLKVPEENYRKSIEAVEIKQNTDGTFDYPEVDTGVMILKTELAAECGELDAGLPRYSFGTTINNIPFCISSDDYSGSVQMYAYENSKYGYRIQPEADETVSIASVYAEYWGATGDNKKGEDTESSGILSAYEEITDDTAKQYFSFAENSSLTAHPIELYKLIYVGEANGKNYTLSDAQSMVTIDNKFTAVGSAAGKGLSTVGGISEAVKTSYVEAVISEQADIADNISIRAYADINLKSEESTVNEWNQASINSLVYEVTPKLEIKGGNTEQPIIKAISDENLDGSKMTLSLCVGNMNPEQIIHHKADGTKEYFYNEHSQKAKKGAKSFCFDPNYSEKGHFVTFSIDSFSDIEILAVAKSETGYEISYTDGVLKITADKDGVYALILTSYSGNQMTAVKVLDIELKKGENIFTETQLDSFSLTNGSKIFLWESLSTLKPVCEACVVNVE